MVVTRLLRILCAFAFGMLLADAAFAASGGPPLAYGGAYDYRLGTGDKIRVTVYDEADLSGDFQIDATGMVRFPFVGQIRAGGMTARDLENNIRTALAAGYLNDPRVAVEITTYRPFYIVGEVLKPGEYPYSNGMTASSAVALAGGFTPKAVQSVLYIRHQGENVEQRAAADQPVLVRPGDVVRVDSTTFWDVMDILAPLAGVSALRYTLQ